MKLIFFLLLAACSSSDKRPDVLLSVMGSGPLIVEDKDDTLVVPDAEPPSNVEKSAIFHNKTDTERLQWAHVSIPFDLGEVKTLSELKGYAAPHGIGEWRVLKWHFVDGVKHSVAIGGHALPIHIKPQEKKEVSISKVEKNLGMPFSYGPLVSAFFKQGLDTSLILVAKEVNKEGLLITSFSDLTTVLHDGEHHKSFRFRSHFKRNGQKHALSATTYMDFYNRQDFGNFVIQVGNNTFEMPYSGGINLEYVDLYIREPMQVNFRPGGSNEAATQSKYPGYKKIRLLNGEIIGDGQARPFRGQWSVFLDSNSFMAKVAVAERKNKAFGIARRPYWESSKAGGIVGNVATIPGNQDNARSVLAAKFKPDYPNMESANYHAIVNVRPSGTGDQPDFSSNMPFAQQYAISLEMPSMIEYMWHGSIAEAFRPSYYFFKDRRMNWTDTSPQCFWWSGRIHYYKPHNAGRCDEWLPRVSGNGFQSAQQKFEGMDDQHFGSPNTRAIYEMTGDIFTRDMLIARQSVALWNKLGDHPWQIGGSFDRVGSERSVRLLEDALQLYLLLPDTKVADKLIEKLIVGVHEFQDASLKNKASFGAQIIETILNDGRHPNCQGVTVGATPIEENRCGITWWSGFHLGFHSAMYRHGLETKATKETIHGYMDFRKFFWQTSGHNQSKRRFNDWGYAPLQGSSFTQEWFSGWLDAVKRVGKDHPDYAWFKNTWMSYWYSGNFFAPVPAWHIHSVNYKWFQ